MVLTAVRFLAREHELDRLRRRLDATVAGRGGVVVVSGPPGMGSTTLARQVADRAAQLDFAIAWGQCIEGTLDRPFGGLAEALEAHALGRPTETVRADLADDVGPILRICPALAAKVPTFSPQVPLDPADERLRLSEALVGWLGRMARRSPLLIVIDDFQLADGDLRGLVEHLARRLRDAPVLVLCVRTTALPRRRWPRLRGALETLELDGLDQGATAALLGGLSDRPLTPAVVALVQRVSRGTPLLSIELCRHLIEENLLPPPGAATLPPPASLPQTLEQVVAWRVARLPAAARAALHVLAAFPRGAAVPLVATVAGLVRARAIEALEALAADGLVTVSAAGQYRVARPAVRGALLDALSAELRAQLNRRVAEALEVDAGERRRELAGTLAHHWSESSALPAGERGMGHCLLAAEQARAAYAHQRMVDCLRAALKLAPDDLRTQLDLHSRLTAAEAAAGLEREALASARRVLQLGETESARHASLRGEAVAAVTDAVRLMRGSGVAPADWPQIDALRTEALFALGVESSRRADRLPHARLELLAESWHEVRLGPFAVLLWGGLQPAAANEVLAQGNEADRAEVVLPQRPRTRADTGHAAESARGWRRPSATLRALASTVTDLVTRHGMFDEGAAWAAQYLATAARDGSPRDQIAALLLLARCRTSLGQFGAAEDAIGRAHAQLHPLPQSNGVEWQMLEDELTIAHWSLAYFRDGNWRSLTKALPAPAVARPAGLLLAALSALGQARLDDAAEARTLLPLVLAAVGEIAPLTLYRDAALVAILAVAWELGAAEHVATAQALLALASGAGAGGQAQGTIGLTEARLLALSGQVDRARATFGVQHDVLDAAGLHPLRALCDYDEAIAIAAAGPRGHEEAIRLLHDGHARFEQLGMSGWAARVEQLLADGLEAAAAPGGRLAFTYPRRLSRPEADVVRLLAGGASAEHAARTLVLEHAVVARLLKSGLAKLGGKTVDQLPQLARRYGLGGL